MKSALEWQATLERFGWEGSGELGIFRNECMEEGKGQLGEPRASFLFGNGFSTL